MLHSMSVNQTKRLHQLGPSMHIAVCVGLVSLINEQSFSFAGYLIRCYAKRWLFRPLSALGLSICPKCDVNSGFLVISRDDQLNVKYDKV